VKKKRQVEATGDCEEKKKKGAAATSESKVLENAVKAAHLGDGQGHSRPKRASGGEIQESDFRQSSAWYA